uniref:Uncharacterized protein n=1 Tax=Trepomonas sp. PC1 TaxID=1076344 RepID=A0A146JWT9_9EUKA|eukprot:JAP88917.1 Hypothetical protein TPC1_31588 [Trepomonas sp. PC1]
MHPNVAVDQNIIGNCIFTVFSNLGISILNIEAIVSTLNSYKQLYAQGKLDSFSLFSVCAKHQDALLFLQMYDSCCVSEAQCERLFSFFKRCQKSFMRQSLKMQTLEHLGRIYVSQVLPSIHWIKQLERKIKILKESLQTEAVQEEIQQLEMPEPTFPFQNGDDLENMNQNDENNQAE